MWFSVNRCMQLIVASVCSRCIPWYSVVETLRFSKLVWRLLTQLFNQVTWFVLAWMALTCLCWCLTTLTRISNPLVPWIMEHMRGQTANPGIAFLFHPRKMRFYDHCDSDVMCRSPNRIFPCHVTRFSWRQNSALRNGEQSPVYKCLTNNTLLIRSQNDSQTTKSELRTNLWTSKA